MDWRTNALAEIRGIKPHWGQRYGWAPVVRERDGCIELFVRFNSRKLGRTFTLRLRYQNDFETAGRREAFVDPENLDVEGLEFWPPEKGAFKRNHNPPAICLEGTYGFHSHLHKDRDGRQANLNRLLIEIQQCLNP